MKSSTESLDLVSWNRKYKQMQKYVEEINAIEDKIIVLTVKKMSIFDEIKAIKHQLDNTCIHPEAERVYDDDLPMFTCKFCGKAVMNV